MSHSGNSNKALSIVKLGPDTTFYAEDECGGIVPGEATSGLYRKGGQLSIAQRFVLALNEVCCERKYGKIYVLLPHPVTNGTRKDPWPAYQATKEVPELYYVPTVWSAEECDEYRTMTRPHVRLHMATHRHGWVDEEIPVLPFALEYQEHYRERPQLDGYTGAPVTVLLGPRPYVGLTKEIRSLGVRKWGGAHRSAWPTKTEFEFAPGAWEDIDQWRVEGGVGVLEKLDKLYRQVIVNGEQCVILCGQLNRIILDAEEKAHRLRENPPLRP